VLRVFCARVRIMITNRLRVKTDVSAMIRKLTIDRECCLAFIVKIRRGVSGNSLTASLWKHTKENTSARERRSFVVLSRADSLLNQCLIKTGCLFLFERDGPGIVSFI